MKTPVLIVSNFLSASGGTRGVCEELAVRLAKNGTPTLTVSRTRNKILRLADMIRTVVAERRNYAVAQVDVYSGPAFFWAEAVTYVLKQLRKPFVLTLHGGNLPGFAQRHPKRMRRLLTLANAVTTPSVYLRDLMSPYRSDLRLIPNALQLDLYPMRVRQSIRPSLVWLRAFHSIYNPLLAPKVMALLARSGHDARLTMIGPDKQDGTLRRTLELSDQLGVRERIQFKGAITKSDVPNWLTRADIFLNTTNVDNMPVSVLEAMACGLCVVSTNVGGIPYFLNNGVEALMVPADDEFAMAAAIERLLAETSLAANLSRNARAKVETADWSVVLPQWEELFASLAQRHGRWMVNSNPCPA